MNKISTRSTKDERLTRLLDAGDVIQGEQPGPVLYAHTVFCQTGLPYRNPGDGATSWQRVNGRVHLAVTAGLAMHPERNELVQLGLAWLALWPEAPADFGAPERRGTAAAVARY